eukprot:1351340-Pyramimonas_sp.AAC.1
MGGGASPMIWSSRQPPSRPLATLGEAPSGVSEGVEFGLERRRRKWASAPTRDRASRCTSDAQRRRHRAPTLNS